MTQRLVLLGTGTNVGKTFVGSALTRVLNQLGYATLGLKPVESGVSAESTSDAKLLHDASGVQQLASHCYALPEPLSPHLAAERAGTVIDLEQIRTWVLHQESQCDTLQYVVIESAGGVFSPLSTTATNLDLAALFPEALWVLVAPDCLGVIHDVTACSIAMRQRSRAPDFVVLSAARQDDSSTGSNARELEKLGIASVAARVERNNPQSIAPFAARLVKLHPPRFTH